MQNVDENEMMYKRRRGGSGVTGHGGLMRYGSGFWAYIVDFPLGPHDQMAGYLGFAVPFTQLCYFKSLEI